jgi:hypothetical protein
MNSKSFFFNKREDIINKDDKQCFCFFVDKHLDVFENNKNGKRISSAIVSNFSRNEKREVLGSKEPDGK